MKKLTAMFCLGAILFASCKKSDDLPDPGTGTQSVVIPPASSGEIRGVISSDQHWTKDKVYRLRGYVYVTNGATLTIDPGTKIVSNKDSAGVLIIYRTAKIMAKWYCCRTYSVYL
ncbi:MAG: hypothetical protein WKG06_24910 [Segetibacter sp.]